MKEINKVICIKSYKYYKPDRLRHKFFTEGKQYDMSIEADGAACYIVSDANYMVNTIDNGLRFYFDGKHGNCEKFGDYFMTLAEWREKQINTIFEDDENN